MVEVILRNGKTVYIDKKLKINLDILLNDVKNANMDLVIVIDGGEGTGKSFMARGLGMYCATYLDSPFTVDDIYFDAETYVDSSLRVGSYENAGYHKINILDEGRHVLNRKRGMSSSNVNFTNYLSECRSLGQVHIILCPAMHDLDKNLIMWRMSILLHTKKMYVQSKKSNVGVKMKRGMYYAYTNKRAIGFCYNDYGYKYPNNYELRSNWSPIEVFSQSELKDYEDKKNEATVKKYATDKELQQVQKTAEENLLKADPSKLIKVADAKNKVNLTGQTLIKMIKRGDAKGTKIAGRWYIDRDIFKLV